MRIGRQIEFTDDGKAEALICILNVAKKNRNVRKLLSNLDIICICKITSESNIFIRQHACKDSFHI